MTGAIVRVDISGDKEVRERLERLQGLDLSPALAAMGEEHVLTIAKRFDAQTDPYGKRWEPRAWEKQGKPDPYGGSRRARGVAANRPILYLSGRLRNSIVYQLQGKTSVLIGSNLVYAATHQFGRGRIPARPYLDVTDADAAKFAAIIVEYLRAL